MVGFVFVNVVNLQN